jgi:hypothetical protein
MSLSEYLGDVPLSQEAARRRALEWVRAKLGQTPYVAEVRLDAGVWHARIDAELPKVLFNPMTGRPHRELYYHFSNVGQLSIDAKQGDFVSKPDFWTVYNAIGTELATVQTSIEKALTRVAAEPFSRLPFGEHMHTPLQSILSWLLMQHSLSIKDIESLEVGSIEIGGTPVKLGDYVSRLEKVGLVRIDGGTALPGNELVTIFAQKKLDHEKIRDAMAFFFARGFGDIESIRQVLGPYLHLSRLVYEDSVETGERQGVSYQTLRQRMVETTYGKGKEFSLPRYLVQLSEVGLIEGGAHDADHTYQPSKKWFGAVMGEQELLAPLRNSIERDEVPS